jgi:hypothetical protein
MQIKSFTFKPKFEAKLKRLRVKRRFIRAINTCDRASMSTIVDKDPSIVAMKLNEQDTWYGFILRAFNWDNTVEDYKFWNNICNS